MIIVHMMNEPFKRYMVCPEDEYLFTSKVPDDYWNGQFYFGAQAIRGRGAIDEQYRSLSGYGITKVVFK